MDEARRKSWIDLLTVMMRETAGGTVAVRALGSEYRGPTRFTNAGPITVTGLTRMVIRKATTGANTRTAHIGRTMLTGFTRTVIPSRTSPIDTRTPGLTQLIVITNPGTASVSDATDSVSEFVCDSLERVVP